MFRSGRTRLIPVALTWLAFLGGAGAAAASNNLGYNGGPVAPSMTGVIVDWGPSVNPIYTNATTGDPGVIKYLAAQSGSTGDIGGVLAQYMDATGDNAANRVSYGHQYAITPSVTSATISDSQIQTELVNQIDAGHLPRPAGNGLGTIYLVLFPKGDIECVDSQHCSANAPNQRTAAFCSYHSATQLPSATSVLYAVLPDNTSGLESSGCGTAATPLENQTAFLSHEWSETITDPLGNGWWVTDPSSSLYGNEVGDSCTQLNATEGGWTVQQEWSNLDGGCRANEPAFAAPTASFLAASTAAPGQPVSFNAAISADPGGDQTAISGTSYSIASGIASYQWNWGDDSSTTSNTPTATHTYAGAGNYEVSLTVTDNLGFTSTVTHPLAVGTSAPPSVTTGGVAGVSDTGATLGGAITPGNQPVEYHFVYGTSPGALSQSTPLATGPSGQSSTAVSATLTALSSSTTYYYRLDVIAGGQTYSGAVQSFATNAAPPPPQTPTVATGGASSVAVTGAVVAGTVDPGGSQAVSYQFAYGTSASNLNLTTPQGIAPAGTTSVSVSASVSGLASGTTYYFRLDVTLGGQTYSGAVQSFTTPVPAPGASTGPAVRVTSTSASVSGTVMPAGVPTSYFVEFGTTTAYGHSTASVSAGAGTTGVPVTVTISGLPSATRLHYRLVATSAGGTSVGADRTFTTAATLKPAPGFRFVVPARASLQRGVRVRFHCSERCSARFTVTLAPAGVGRSVPVPVSLGEGSGSVRGRGWGTAALHFGPSVRRRGSLRLIVYGYAVSSGSAPTAPKAERLTLT